MSDDIKQIYEQFIDTARKTVLHPMPEVEAVRYYWDEESSSVKGEIIPMANIFKQPGDQNEYPSTDKK